MLLRATLALAAFTAAGTLALAPAHELTDERRAAVVEEVRAFIAHYDTVTKADDMEAIRALFVTDDRFIWAADGVFSYRSPDDIIDRLESMGDFELDSDYPSVEIVPLTPDHAHVRIEFVSRILSGEVVVYEFTGVNTWIVERAADGTWRLVAGHSSTPEAD